MTQRYDYDFDAEAVNNTAAAIFRVARDHGPKVLDLGSGPAVVSSRLARELGFDVTCVDSDADAIAVARDRGVARAFVHDLTGSEWVDDVRGEAFDLIILADVLEHLPRPQELLATVRDAALLAPGGRMVLSIPNASHEMVISSLLVDDFRYSDTGVMDHTHIRWFTRKSLQRLLESEGYSITSSATITRTLEQTSHSELRIDLDPELRRAVRDRVPHSSVYQYVFVVAPIEESVARTVSADDVVVRDAASLADAFLTEYTQKIAELENAVAEARAEVGVREARNDQLAALLRETRQHAARELAAAAAEQERIEALVVEASKKALEAVRKEKKTAGTVRRLRRELKQAEDRRFPRVMWIRPRRFAGRVKRRLQRLSR